MAMIKRDGLPEFWVTGIAKILVGEQPCQLEAWTKGHYKLERREKSGKFAQWQVDHTAQMEAARKKLVADGWKVNVEQYMKLRGQTAILAGKADLVTYPSVHTSRPVIRDVKSGEPRESHIAQVLIYMIGLPMAWQKAMTFSGQVIYPTHTVDLSPEEAQAIRPKLFALLRQLAGTTAPEPLPSQSACRFCELETCTVRWTESQSEVVTDAF